MNRKGCRFDPLGARVADQIMSLRWEWGISSSVYRRIARVVDNPSSKPIGDSVMGFSDRFISFLLLDKV